MRKYILIPILLISLNSFSQTETTVTYGDSVYRVRYINNYVSDSAIRWNYFVTRINDSTYIKDSTPYMFRFRRITGVTKDSVFIPTKLKTVGLTPIVGIGDIPVATPVTNNAGLTNGAGYITASALSPYSTTVQATALYSGISHNHSGVYQPVGSYLIAADIAGKQNNITLTTTGSGAATLVGSTLNIPTPGTGTPTFLNLASNFSSTITTEAAVTGWTFPVTINKTYRVEVIAAYQTAATTTGGELGFFLTASGAGTVRGYAEGAIVSTAAATALTQGITAIGAADLAGSNLITTGVTAINSPHYFTAVLTFTCTASGTFNVGWASEVAASAAQLNSGSTLLYQQLN